MKSIKLVSYGHRILNSNIIFGESGLIILCRFNCFFFFLNFCVDSGESLKVFCDRKILLQKRSMHFKVLFIQFLFTII